MNFSLFDSIGNLAENGPFKKAVHRIGEVSSNKMANDWWIARPRNAAMLQPACIDQLFLTCSVKSG
jgi:hypothetical protein